MGKLKVIDLFCGIGGFHYAAKRNGFDVVFASEIDKFAMKQYALNHGLEPHGDITKIPAEDIPAHDLLMGGFPCITGDAVVKTDKGVKFLRSIRPGDMVLGHDRQYHKVLRFMNQGVKPVIRVLMDSSFSRSYIECTPEHRFLVMGSDYDSYVWVEAQNLKLGDILVGSFGQRTLRVCMGVGKASALMQRVYDIEVEGCHSFTANGCFVHNCQAFSLAGKRKGFEDARGTLFFEIARILDAHKPRFFLLENVKGLLSHKSKVEVEHIETDLYGNEVSKKTDKVVEKTFDIMSGILIGLGYRIRAKVLNSKDFGVPQNRERIFIVGFRDEADYHKFQFPAPIPLDRCVRDILEDADFRKYGVSESKISYIKDSGRGSFYSLDSEVSRTLLAGDFKDFKNLVSDRYVLSPKSQNSVKRREGKFTAIDPEVAPALLARYEGMGNGAFVSHLSMVGLYKGLNMQGMRVYDAGGISATLSSCGGGPGAKTGLYRIGSLSEYQRDGVSSPNVLSAAITADGAKNGDNTGRLVFKEPFRIRRLTPRECARLQGFPEEYKIECSDSQAYKQFGNSVTVNVIEAILGKIRQVVFGE